MLVVLGMFVRAMIHSLDSRGANPKLGYFVIHR
jgi:hypothetical protein